MNIILRGHSIKRLPRGNPVAVLRTTALRITSRPVPTSTVTRAPAPALPSPPTTEHYSTMALPGILPRRVVRTPRQPSPRTPNISINANQADVIERDLQKDGHRTWGFVIYRCTYKSDPEWKEFMQRLRGSIEKTLRFYNGLDMMDRLALTVFNDASLFDGDGGSASAVRDHFKKWAATAPQQEQGTQARGSQRYQFCIQVTEEALDSVLRKAPKPGDVEVNREGFVNLIWRDWEPYTEEEEEELGPPEQFEPIEGCTLEDVGWFKVAYDRVMPGVYMLMRDGSLGWENEYRRPPEILIY